MRSFPTAKPALVRLTRSMVLTALWALVGCTLAVAGALNWAGSAVAKGPGPDPYAAVVSVELGPYGPVLVVGGEGAGYVPASSSTPATFAYPAGSSLFYPTIDPRVDEGYFFDPGCTTTLVAAPTLEGPGPLSCTGAETDIQADWPAFTTDRPPVAGAGVDRSLLGEVYRPDMHTFQVTYAGHPLYLFDPVADSFFGANFFESVLPLPPWHTAWYLITPDGLPATGPAALEIQAPQTGATYTSNALSVEMLPGIGGAPVTVYAFSRDTPSHSRCFDACAKEFIPVRTDRPPTEAPGVNTAAVGAIRRPDRTFQVTYNGHPLYIYSGEQAFLGATGYSTAGNGNGDKAFGGTFTTVSP